MPALPSVPKVVRADMHFVDSSDLNAQIRWFMNYTGVSSVLDMQTWVDLIHTEWVGGASWRGNISVDVILKRIVLTDLSSNTAPQTENDAGGAGTNSGAPLSAGAAMVVKFHILRRYRGGHPRVYLPGMPQAYLDTLQSWSSAGVSNVLTNWQAFISTIVAGVPAAMGASQQVNVSYYQGFHNVTYPSGRTRPVPTLRSTPLVDLVIGSSINPKVASQRRRNLQSA